MRQVIYTSVSTAREGNADLDGILEQSRHNNAIDGITGLLWSDGAHFLQVLEGPEASVEAALVRIRADPRHRDIDVQRDVEIEERDFGDWTMAVRTPRDRADPYDVRMRRLLKSACPEVKGSILALMAS